MGQTAEIMTHELALKLRDMLDTLFTLSKTQCYYVAIRKTYPALNDEDWEVCLYCAYRHSTFLLPLATLAHTLDSMIPELNAGIDTYDVGTTDEDKRTCITLH